jgi:CMP-N-acetylneuraminic acid synthetase
MSGKMSKKPFIYAMIPARFGSTRLKMKNLALIDGQPMISYAINAAKDSNIFDRIIVNSEHIIFRKIAKRYGVDFYHRPQDLGTSQAKSDSVVANFMSSYAKADIIVWVNPIAPFQTGKEVSDVVNYFVKNKLDSLITVEEIQVHCNYKKQPVNYDKDEVFSQTQDLIGVQPFVYSIMMWKKETFLREFSNKGHALFCGRFETYPVSKASGIIVKTSEDLKIADLMMRSINNSKSNYVVEYDELANKEYK